MKISCFSDLHLRISDISDAIFGELLTNSGAGYIYAKLKRCE